MHHVLGRGKVKKSWVSNYLSACTYGVTDNQVGLRKYLSENKLPEIGHSARRSEVVGWAGTVDEGGDAHCAMFQRTRDRAVQGTQTS